MTLARRHIVWLALVLAALIIAAAAIFIVLDPTQPDETGIVLTAGDAEVVAVGQRVYAEQCAVCHGANLEGQPNWRERLPNGRLPAPPHDETGHTWHHTDEVLFALTRDGLPAITNTDYETDMPAYADVLTDDEIIAVLSYIKSTWPENIQERHDEINAAQR